MGRDQALDDLASLLPECRLLTLTGPPGIGKTRLAVEFVSRIRDCYPRGVYFADLSSVLEPGMVQPAIAAMLGIRQSRGQSWQDAWASALAGGPALLLLDNCEHLVDDCATLVAQLLQRCPELTVLCTSREALWVPGETTFSVRGLPSSVPDDGPQVADPDAVRLFVQRAKACHPGLVLSAAERRTVAELCGSLDGSPLAIELAARWVRTLPVKDILARLSDRLDLLVAGPRTAADRQRSLRNALDWSHATLDGRECAVFRRLAVLAGWFDLDSATAVCAGGDVPARETLHVLDSLQAKSLLVAAEAGRFRQLESIRLYAREHLELAGEVDLTHGRLVEWLCRLAAPLVDDPVVTAEVQRSLAARQNWLRHAVEWAVGHGDGRQVLLAVALCRGYLSNGYVAESIKLMDRVLPAAAPPAVRALAFAETSYMLWCDGNYQRARELAEQAVATGRDLGDPVALARGLQKLAMVRQITGDLEFALECLEERLALIRSLGVPVHTAMCLNDVAWTTIQHGHHDRAAQALAEALPVLREYDEPHLLASVLHTDAALALVDGDLDRAEDDLVEVLHSPDLDREDLFYCAEGLAIVAARRGEADRALRLVGATAALRARQHMQAEPWWQRRLEQAETTARAAVPADRADEMVRAGRRMEPDNVLAHALRRRAPEPDDDAEPLLLTDRERQVADLVAEGATNRRISRRLGISERTVESHLKSIRDRLSLDSRTAVAVWATRNRDRWRQP